VQQRKTVTIVFTDLVGSTSLGEALDPELVRRIMTTYFDRMRTVLEHHGGTVEKYIGDAIMAVFGIPEVREDDALRAARAAYWMRTGLGQLNRDLEKRYGVQIDARTGVNTGEVLATPAEPDMPLASDASNVAARLQQAARPGEILIGEATYRLVRDAVTVEPAGALELKGKTAPLAAWRLLAVSEAGLGIARNLDSPIVGRDSELALLSQSLNQAASDRACRLITVLGAPGLGKSRLATEFIDQVGRQAMVLRGRCPAYGEGITYLPVAEILREAAGIAELDTPEKAIAKLAAVLTQHEEAGTITERLGSLLGLIDATAPSQETFWAVRRLLEVLAEERPVVIVFDDIHWGEVTFLDLVEYLAGWSAGAPILLLCLSRPELIDLRPAWGAGVANATSIRLAPLTENDSDELIDNLLGRASLESEAITRIRNAAEGNPLFVEEIIRMLVDEGLLRRDDGGWVATGDLASIAIPATISALLSARLDRLSPGERALIQRASVMGKVFWWGAVAELSPETERADVGGHLQALVRREMVRPDRSQFSGEDAFRFSHILIRDAAYAGTTKELRSELHERAAGWLERRAADRPTEFEEIVGYHLEQAHRYRVEVASDDQHAKNLARRAAARLAGAGQRALARSDIPAAVALLARATDLLEPNEPQRIELLVDLGQALSESGEEDRGRAVLRDAGSRAETLGDERLVAHVSVGSLDAWSGAERSSEEDREQARRAIEVFERHGDDRGLARAWGLMAWVEWRDRRAAEAERASERALEHARRAGSSRDVAASVYILGPVLAHVPGSVEDAAKRAEELIEEEQGNRTVEAYLSHALAHLRAWAGRFEEARRHAARYRSILLENGQEALWSDSAEAAADVELWAGHPEAALRILTEGQRRFEELGVHDPVLFPFLARALLAAGRPEEAERWAEKAAETPHGLWRPLGLAMLARVRAHQGRGEEAEALARQAVGDFEHTDFLIFRGQTLVALADVLRLLGREDEASRVAEEAIRLFEGKGATALAEAARSSLGLQNRT
jgi:class 3 adenylate cyclase/tetratricopeptide (TPR) repeat protein